MMNNTGYCPQCNEELSKESPYCLYCGSKIPEKPTLTESTSKKHSDEAEMPKLVPEELLKPIIVKPELEKKPLRKRQLDWSDIVSFGWLTILGSIIFVTALIIITLANPSAATRWPVGLLVFTFLLLVAGIIFDVLRWRNFDFSALGAIIAYIGIVMIFYLPIAYAFYIRLDFIFSTVWVVISILFIVGGAGARWSDYDTKIINLATMVIAYWQNYQKREAIKKLLRLLFVFLGGLVRSIGSGIRHFPERLTTFLVRVLRGLKTYFSVNIKLIKDAIIRIFQNIWNNTHWFGLLAIIAFLCLTGFSTDNHYRNIELIIIMSFFFVLGILTTRSERFIRTINTTRTTVLKGAISAYSMLTGVKIKKEESIFCSRCLRGVHKIEFEELKEVEDTDQPLCPYCNHKNWVSGI
jgi:hypothetical protein